MPKITFKIDVRKVVSDGYPGMGECYACKAFGKFAKHGYPHRVKVSNGELRHTARCPMNKLLNVDGSFKSNKLQMITFRKQLNEVFVREIDLSDVHCLACGAFGNIWVLGFYGYPNHIKPQQESTILRHKDGCPINKLLNDDGFLKKS